MTNEKVGATPPPLPAESAADAAAALHVRDDAHPSTDAIQTIQHRTWTRAIWAGVGVCILLVALGWVAGSIANRFALTEFDKAEKLIEEQADATAVASEDGDDLTVVLRWSDALQRATLRVDGLQPVGDDQEYAVWFVNGSRFDRAVAFEPRGEDAEVLLDSLWKPGDHLMISLEPEGGTSSGLPLGDPLVSLPIVAP